MASKRKTYTYFTEDQINIMPLDKITVSLTRKKAY
jgi:hypothetical protein